MAFLAVCPECGHSQICVLDIQVQPRLVCSRCRNVFHAARAAPEPVGAESQHSALIAELRSGSHAANATASSGSLVKPVPESRPLGKQPVAVAPTSAKTIAVPSATPVSASKPQPAVPATSTVFVPSTPIRAADTGDNEDEDPSPRWLVLLRKWMDPLGATGLGVCAVALLCAAISRLSVLVWPLALVAVLVGVVAIRRAYRTERPLVMPIASAAVGMLIFLLAIGLPAALGPGYEASRDRAPADDDVRVLPHLTFVNDPNVSDSGWINASKASMQQGRVRVDVTDVWVEPASPTRAGGELFVRVRLQRIKTGQEIAKGAFASPLVWDEKVKATVHDLAGANFVQKPTPAGRPRAPGPSSASTITVDFSNELLVFDAPATSAQGFRLEVPAVAWGGTGILRFSIPASIVRQEQAPPRPK